MKFRANLHTAVGHVCKCALRLLLELTVISDSEQIVVLEKCHCLSETKRDIHSLVPLEVKTLTLTLTLTLLISELSEAYKGVYHMTVDICF